MAGLVREYEFIITRFIWRGIPGGFPGTTIDKMRHFVDSEKVPSRFGADFRALDGGKLSTK
jgi:hypothetical protein